MDSLKSPEPKETSGPFSLQIRDALVWTGSSLTRGSILLENGRIKTIARKVSGRADNVINARGLVALPGLVDAHVHLRDMKLSYKEDFTSGTSAAAAGGFTTVLDMPNTEPPTDSANRLLEKAERASRAIVVNVGFHSAAVEEQDAAMAMRVAGSFSMKLYLPKPIAPLDVLDDNVIANMLEAARRASLPVTVHAEDATQFDESKKSRTIRELAKSRPEDAETEAVNRIIRLRNNSTCKIHFCHITLSTSITAIEKSGDSLLSSEVTPHHTLLSEDSLKKLSWKAWMVPPLRSRRLKNQLLQKMLHGDTTVIATDHAPHTIEEKRQLPSKSPPGIPGLETALPLMLTLVNKGKLSLGRLVSLLSTNPAEIFGLSSKGRLDKGADADVVLVDMKKRAVIDPTKFLSKAHYSPFEGRKTRGAVHTTIVNGQVVYHEGEIVGKPGSGMVLKSEKRE
ncbi:MAG TPA: dihydroorotase family protein [Candidatus Bathyarchaeia archaeon]|nr:dihydroorotase family protein [Candidatus Bathyarchaeia archaeon]